MERLDAFMARANAAYYATHNPFADFTTAPEITQAFGEVLGLWAAVVWQTMGAPDPVLLVEAGPGRGTLMSDALRAIGQAAPVFRAALRLHLIETSARLRNVQAQVLPGAAWHDVLEAVPEGPFILLANEFLDTLPIRQFVRREGRWAERFVADGKFVERATAEDQRPALPDESEPGAIVGQDTFDWRKPPQPRSPLCPAAQTAGEPGRVQPDLPPGTVVEINEPARAFIATLARRLTACPGAALCLDYGPGDSAPGDSLQALAAGQPADPLGPPGATDLTAHVDFAALGRIACAAGACVHGPLPQGVFLTRLGLMSRTGALARSQPPARAAALIEASRRLIEPDQMGRLFKAMAVCSPRAPTPPGFER
jgi:NADH dehydrogenase [ubiquinone] 1 alpha subcomplex assembly factor 7